METKKLKCIDVLAPSDKYPHYGCSIDFVDEQGVKYFAEYPYPWARPSGLESGEIYLISFVDREVKDPFFNIVTHKMTRLKNIKKVNSF